MNDIEHRLRAAMNAAAELWSAENQAYLDVSRGQTSSRRPPVNPDGRPAAGCRGGRRLRGRRSPAGGSHGGTAELWLAGLMEGVRRRHRRHVRRMSAASVVTAVAIALAVPPAGHALWAGLTLDDRPVSGPTAGGGMPTFWPLHGPSSTGTAFTGTASTGTASTGTSSTGTSSTGTSLAGTSLLGCDAESDGGLPANWRSASLRIGPMWLAYARPQGYVHHLRPGSRMRAIRGNGKLRIGVMITEVAYGATVLLKVDRAAWSYFRFQPRFSASGTAGYTLRNGATGLRFVACPRGTPPGVNGKVTDFYLGFLIKAGSHAPVSVWLSPAAKPYRLIFTCPGLGCEGR
jgi:hypothetical protein